MCFINDLKSDTMYIVRVSGRNVVGYSEFTEKKAQTGGRLVFNCSSVYLDLM